MSGFVELQVNGHGGIDFLSAQSVDEVRIAARSLATHGVSHFLPTLITSNFEQLSHAAALIREVQANPGDGEAQILGLHLEGPFISEIKCGVHPHEYISKVDLEYARTLLAVGDVKIMTLAPELAGATELISMLCDLGVIASLGHSNATLKESHAGFDAGAKTVTHLFNAMSKEGGLAEAALSRDDVMIQIIVDDVHVPREKVYEAISRSHGRFILTNDAVAPAGLGDGRYAFGEMEIEIRDGQARRIDGTLAGGIGTLAESLRILNQLGIDEKEAIASVTTRPRDLLTR